MQLSESNFTIHTMPEKSENKALFIWLGQPFTLIRHKNGLFENIVKPEEFENTGFSFSCG